jgi:hypothetical protein
MTKRYFWRAIRLVTLGAGITTYALADDFPGSVGPSGSGLMVATDGPYVTACWNDSGSLPLELSTHIAYVNSTVASSTNLEVVVDSCDTTTTDMRFDDNLTTGGFLGLATCLIVGGDLGQSATATDVECEQWQIQINPSLISSSCGSSYGQSVWCHETGHGLGLGHENNCMATGCTTSKSYSSHHITAHLASL